MAHERVRSSAGLEDERDEPLSLLSYLRTTATQWRLVQRPSAARRRTTAIRRETDATVCNNVVVVVVVVVARRR